MNTEMRGVVRVVLGGWSCGRGDMVVEQPVSALLNTKTRSPGFSASPGPGRRPCRKNLCRDAAAGGPRWGAGA
jgi:hypothetical protein